MAEGGLSCFNLGQPFQGLSRRMSSDDAEMKDQKHLQVWQTGGAGKR